MRQRHGGKGTRLYTIWKSIHYRCAHVPKYRDRGITVCPAWSGFIEFREWALANGYSDSLTIERKDYDGPYHPSNCCWIPAVDQAVNRRIVNLSPDGTPWCVIAKRHGVSVSLMNGRIREGWPPRLAATLSRGTRIAPPRARDEHGKFCPM